MAAATVLLVVHPGYKIPGTITDDPRFLACVVGIIATASAGISFLLASLGISIKAMRDVAVQLGAASVLARSGIGLLEKEQTLAPGVAHQLRLARRALHNQIIGVCASFVTSVSIIPGVLLAGMMLRDEHRGDIEVGPGEYVNASWKILDVIVNLTTAVLMCGGHRPMPKLQTHSTRSLACCRPKVLPEWSPEWRLKVSELAGRSITVSELLDFYQGLGDRYMPHYRSDKHTTNDVVRQAIIPLSRESQSAYASAKGVRYPDKMVTHNWGNLFRDLVAAVLADVLQEVSFELIARLLVSDVSILKGMLSACGCSSASYWICAFCVNQHASICGGFGPEPQDGTQRREWDAKRCDTVSGKEHPQCDCLHEKYFSGTPSEMNKFDDMMWYLAVRNKSFSQLVAVDVNFDLFSRCWCVAEIAEAHRLGLVQRVQISSGRDFEASKGKLRDLDINNMAASHPDDKRRILQKIGRVYQQEGGVAKFNQVVKSLLFGTSSGLLAAWQSRDTVQQLGEAGRLVKWAAADRGSGGVWQQWESAAESGADER